MGDAAGVMVRTGSWLMEGELGTQELASERTSVTRTASVTSAASARWGGPWTVDPA